MPEMSIQEAIEIAKRLHQQGNLQEAEGIYRQILAAIPEHPEALHLMGLAEFQSGRLDAAVELIRRAIAAEPRAPHYHLNLGLVLMGLTRFEDAVTAFQQALTLHADYPEAREKLGEAYAYLGASLYGQGRVRESIDVYRKSLEIKPDRIDVLNNLGVALIDLGLPQEAMGPLEKVLVMQPGHREAALGRATALRDLMRLDEAMEVFTSAAASDPEWYLPKYSMGMLHLLRGEFRQGWPLLESRWADPEMARFRQTYGQPQWRGEALEGRRIILHAEQGFGDAIQFIRYVSKVIERGGTVIVACEKPLLELFRSNVQNVEQWVTPGTAMPAYDVHASLMSLPMIFETVEATIPRDVPYLRADAGRVSKWRDRLAGAAGAMKIGLVWAGRPTHRLDRTRSVSPELFAPLTQVQGVRLFSLQGGQQHPGDLKSEISDFTSDLTDFAETAGLVDQLDLVITVDTAMAHLAGAMGKPVWVLLPRLPDWRWMLDRDDSPWYPTMRLFRQERIGDWAGVIQRVAGEVEDLRKNQGG